MTHSTSSPSAPLSTPSLSYSFHSPLSQPDLLKVLRPAGGGVYVVSTGLSQQKALQKEIYGVQHEAQIEDAWASTLETLDSFPLFLLGVPSDTGAGFTRGANLAPAELRAHLIHHHPNHPLLSSACADVGDVRVVPQLLSDEMLSDEQFKHTRSALYNDENSSLPVGPLSICEAVLNTLSQVAPQSIPVVLGGDHSVGWPAFKAAFDRWEVQKGKRVGLLHFDAHTDLLSERLGVKYCFATWAWHANQLLKEDGRLVQVGIRASGRTKEHWETQCNVRQYWPDETQNRSIEEIANEIIQRFRDLKVDVVYVSNDIDGTDLAFAGATGTPESNGLTPDQVDGITQKVCEAFPLIGADLVEVAPPLSRVKGEPETTFNTASRYLKTLAQAALDAHHLLFKKDS